MRLIREVVLEWAHIKDKINTFQKSQDYGNCYYVLRECQIDDFSPEWIFHARWLSLDTLPNMLYSIFHVWLSTSEKRSVNHNSNLIKVVVFTQYWEVGLRWRFSIHWGNITTLMRFELSLTLLLSLVLIRTWNIGYNMLVQGTSTSVEYSFSAENHQFDTLSVHNSNYLNLVTFEMC